MKEKMEGFVGQRAYVMPNELLLRMSQHPLLQTLHITDIGYYPKASFHWRERKLGCSQYILIYCVHGNGYYEIEGKHYDVKADSFFILPANVPHQYGANLENPWSIYWVHFTGTNAPYFAEFLTEKPDEHCPITIEPNKERIELFENVLSHIEMSLNDDNIIYANMRFSYFLSTFKASIFNTGEEQLLENDSISKVIAYMREHLTETLTLEQLAAIAGMSTSHFSAVFRQRVQRSPIHFFTFLKMQQACQLLEYSKMRVKEIAYQIGYSDPYHFSRVFTTVMGISPKDFRQKNKI